ncbi:MAG: tetratricopeptide repeat protein, partial [Campylobacterota bacterium]|nr:tetratricopeptide repeat protein [Campylobacterota bacterium]
MQIVFIIFFLLTSLVANSKETCYTVQLISKHSSKKNLDLLRNSNYPDSCKLMEIGSSLTLRCGCYEKIAPAKESLLILKKDYSKATIATTYKYRFEDKDDFANKEKVKQSDVKPLKKKRYRRVSSLAKSDEELRLILQVFLYKGDLEYAYKVATIGYEQNKESYYWNQKMAEICKWTNRSARSMKHLRFMYEIEYDKEIEQELIDYGSASYQYEEIEPLVVSRAMHNPTEENIDLMILVFKEIGSPEKVVKVLESEYSKDMSNTMLLTKALELSLEMGDLKLSKKYVNMIEKKKPYSKKDAYLIAKYYYVKRDTSKAYETILQVDDKKTEDERDYIKYYQLKSDLGWYIQDNLNAAGASKYLMEMDEARLVDYERIAFVYQKKEPKIARLAIKKAYTEYKLSYLFYGYANEAINSKDFDGLNELLITIDKGESTLLKEASYWIIKAQVYAYYNQKELEKEALLYALEIEPDNYQTKLTLLWYFIEVHDYENIKIILADMTEDKELDSSLYLPMAAAYFDINDINRASYYTQELIHLNNPVTKLIEFKFLQAYIFQIQNNEPAFKSSMRDILADLKTASKKDPELKKQDLYLSNYLRAAMYIDRADKFAKKLKKAKKYLSEKNYNEIAYSWAVKNSAYEESLKIYHRMYNKELWVRFSNNIIFQDHTRIENLLDLYLKSLSMGDASQAAGQDGQVALAQTVAFEELLNNDYNQNAYVHYLDLSKKRSDNLDIKTAYSNRDPLAQNYIKIKNSIYLQNGWHLKNIINYFSNKTLDKKVLLRVPETTVEAGLGLKKTYDRGHLAGNIEFYDSMESYFGYSVLGSYRFSTDLIGSVTLAKNKNALESVQLQLGGKKDMLSLNLIWNILNSTSVDFLHEQNRYTSQDGIDLG